MKKFAVVFLLLSLMLGMFAGCNTVGHEHNHTEEEPDSTQNQPTEEQTTLSEWEKQKQQYTNAETTYEKVYWQGTIDDLQNAKDNVVGITIAYPYNNREYTVEDFAEYGCIEIRSYWTKQKERDVLIYSLTLAEHSKQNVIDTIRALEKLEFIRSAEPEISGPLHNAFQDMSDPDTTDLGNEWVRCLIDLDDARNYMSTTMRYWLVFWIRVYMGIIQL